MIADIKNILFYRNSCVFCGKVALAMNTLSNEDLDSFTAIEKEQALQTSKYATKLQGRTFPTLLLDGKYITDSNIILETLGAKYKFNFTPNTFSNAEIEDFVKNTSLNLRVSIQYYYKLHFKNSIVNNEEKNKLAETENNQVNSTQKFADIIEQFIARKKSDALAEEDLYIYPEIAQYENAEEACNFKLGVKTKEYLRRLEQKITSVLKTMS